MAACIYNGFHNTSLKILKTELSFCTNVRILRHFSWPSSSLSFPLDQIR